MFIVITIFISIQTYFPAALISVSEKRSPTPGTKEGSPATLPGTLNYQSLLSLTALSPAGHPHSPTLDQVRFICFRHYFMNLISFLLNVN